MVGYSLTTDLAPAPPRRRGSIPAQWSLSFRGNRPSPSRRVRCGTSGPLDEGPVAVRSDACANRSGPRRHIFLADQAGLTRFGHEPGRDLSFASLRTRGVAASPAWKMASTNRFAARRRVQVRGRRTGTTSIRWNSPGWRRSLRLKPTPAAGRRGLSRWPPSTLARPPHQVSEGTRRRARAGRQARGPVQPTGSAGKMPRLDPDRDAQAS